MLWAQPGLRVVANCGLRKETSYFGPFGTHVSLQTHGRARSDWAETLSHGRGCRTPRAQRTCPSYTGLRFARIRCSVRRCIVNRRAVSETLRLHNS